MAWSSEKYKQWSQSPAGKASMRNRRKRYRATEKGKTKHRQGCLRHYYKYRDNPSWKAHLLETQMYQKARRKAAKVLAGIPFEISFTLQDAGTMTVHIYKGVA